MSVHAKHSLIGNIASKAEINGAVNISSLAREELERFEGPYTIIPAISKQILNTKQKAMTNDVIIESIPYAEVSNSANGLTVTIGG